MRLFEIVYESREVINKIEKECSKFLKESKSYEMYRGTKSHDSELYIGEIRQNRKPVDTSLGINFFEGVDYGMKKSGFKATRSNSIICTGDRQIAYDYGNIYLIFVISDFNYTYSVEVNDYVTNYLNYISMHDEEKIEIEQTFEDGLNYWEEVEDTYTSDRLYDGIQLEHEILISGKSYYGIKYKTELYEQIKDYFDLKN